MDMVTYLECCASCCFENSLHLFLEETRCSSRSVHRSFHLPHVSRFFSTTRRIHRNQLVLWHFPTSSHRDRNTFKQLMSNHCIVLNLSSNLHQVRRQPFTCLVVIDRSVVYFVSGNVTHRNLVDKDHKRTHRKTGHRTLSFAVWLLLFICFVTSRDKWSDRCDCGMCSAAHCRLNVL